MINVLDFAQLAIAAYGKDDPILNERDFHSNWVKVDCYPRPDDGIFNFKVIDYDIHNGFSAAFYIHSITGCGVIAIRGTNPKILDDLLNDAAFSFNLAMSQYDDAILFCNIIKTSPYWKNLTKIYICGHSLGGILAKMISPFSHLDTIAFNSPGVVNELTKQSKSTRLNFTQKIVTYIAQADLIGNFEHLHDFGAFKMVNVLNGKPLNPAETSSIISVDSLLTMVKHGMEYHLMTNMYNALKGQFQHDYI